MNKLIYFLFKINFRKSMFTRHKTFLWKKVKKRNTIV